MTELERRHHDAVVTALWAAIDVIRERVGPFDVWPAALKDAFSEAVIDYSPPSEADIARTLELAMKYGWDRQPTTGAPTP